MKKYIYAGIMVLYISLSIVTINYASNWVMRINYSMFVSKARDLALLTVKNFKLSNEEVEELKKLEFKDLFQNPINTRLMEMFKDNTGGFDTLKYVYIMAKLEKEQIKYTVTKENEEFYGAPAGTPLNGVWLVVGKTTEEVLADESNDDIKRYTYLRDTNETAFRDKTQTHAMANDEYGLVISYLVPFYSEEGAFVGLLGIDVNIDEYQRNANLIKLLLLIVFLVPSITLTALYILLYVINLKKAFLTSNTDPLTSVKNRRFMEKFLAQTIKEHHKKQAEMSVIMIDIDFFKKYNDNYGHQQGDKVLIEVTKGIASVLRDNTDVICRYGGEEFLVILPNTKSHGAEVVAGRIKTKVNGLAIKHEYSEAADFVTISQGVYSAVPLNTDSVKTFIEFADKGMYKAKNWGRNRYAFMEAENRS